MQPTTLALQSIRDGLIKHGARLTERVLPTSLRNSSVYRRLESDIIAPARWRRKYRWRERFDETTTTSRGFHEHRCIFVHVPKAAGISVVTTLLGNLGCAHTTVATYRKALPRRTFDSYFKFTFVRNPWDRTHSAFTFLKHGSQTDFHQNWGHDRVKQIDSFERFVHECLAEPWVQDQIQFKPQSHFLLDDSGEMPIDFVGRFERINDDFAEISRRVLGREVPLPHKNRTKQRTDYRSEYTPAMIERVREVYARDVELLGYDFEG